MSIKIENVDIYGWEAAIRGARNPMNSWEKSDSWFYNPLDEMYSINGQTSPIYNVLTKLRVPKLEGYGNSYLVIGPNDHKLLMNLCKGGSEESKWRRFVHVFMDITAPLYWYKEFETYKVGVSCNSCSTMHKIHAKEFTLEDFSCEHLIDISEMNSMSEHKPNLIFDFSDEVPSGKAKIEICPLGMLKQTVDMLNRCRDLYLETKDKKYWWQMIQLLPSSYNQWRTIDLNYEVLAKQYRERKNHKLDEWIEYCEWIKTLPYSELITLEEGKNDE